MNPAGKIKSILFVCTLILSIASGAKGGSVVVSADVPTTDIIVSDGEERATFTKIFDVDASDNHGRGNTFTTPNDFVGTGWVMTGLTIRKYNNQTYNNDTLKLWIFEGDADQWAGGDGDSDGDMLDGTGITNILLDGEAFTLNGAIANNSYVQLTLDSAIPLEEDMTYIWFAKYEQIDGGQNMFQLVQANSTDVEPGSNQLQITTTENKKVSSPNPLTHYVQGYATGSGGDDELLAALADLERIDTSSWWPRD